MNKRNFKEGTDDKFSSFSRPVFLESFNPEATGKAKGVYEWIFKGSVPKDGFDLTVIVFYIPSIPSELMAYYSGCLSHLEKIKPADFYSVLKAYYQNIAFNKQADDVFLKKYFKEVILSKIQKKIIFDEDKKNLEEIAKSFDALITIK